MKTPNKYPSTLHWVASEKIHRDDSYHTDHEYFVNKPLIITEKLDGGNTCLFNGEVFARSVTSPSHDGWMAMVRRHHAWKTNSQEFKDISFYGEDLYGIHSIEYDAVEQYDTYRLFAVRRNDEFLSWDDVKGFAAALDVNTVPVLSDGAEFETEESLTKFLKESTAQPSVLGPDREGCVLRTPEAFPASEFGHEMCKYVRANHVQTDQHWRINWQPCKVKYK